MQVADTSVPVLVLKLFHHCALGIVRSLGRLGVPVYAVNRDAGSAVARSRYCRKTFCWDLDRASDAETVEFLLEVARKIGSRPILIPTDDGNNSFAFRNLQALKQGFTVQDVSAEIVFQLYSKKGMYSLAKKYGVPTPGTIFPKSRADVLKFLENAVFPVALKGIDTRLLHQRTGTRMLIAKDDRELLESYDRMEDPAQPNILLQEHIPGDADSTWMFDGYFNKNSDCLVAFTGRKLRQYPPYTGTTSLGICEKNGTVERISRDFLKAVGYRGMVDMGYRYDHRDGKYKLVDVNPRIGATFRLFVDPRNGLDILRAFYLDLTSQPVPPASTCDGRKWLVENHDLMSLRLYHRDRKLTFTEWVRSLRGVQEAAWFAWDDPLSFVTMWGGFFRELLGWVAKKLSLSGKKLPEPPRQPREAQSF